MTGFDSDSQAEKSALSFSFGALNSRAVIKLSDYAGKVLLIVNTASKCGFTGQYQKLETLYQQYKAKGLVVIGVPSGDFGDQEFDSSEEIATFCKMNYGVTFPMAAKSSIKGDNAHPFYQWTKEVLGFGTAPKWNFHKYLIAKNGVLVDYFHSKTSPDSPRLVTAIEKWLAAE